MNPSEMQQQIEQFKYLIGMRYQGMDIDEVIAAPSDERAFAVFSDRYMKSFDAKFALEPFVEDDLHLIAVLNRYHIREYGFFYRVPVAQLLEETRYQPPQ